MPDRIAPNSAAVDAADDTRAVSPDRKADASPFRRICRLPPIPVLFQQILVQTDLSPMQACGLADEIIRRQDVARYSAIIRPPRKFPADCGEP